jgi:uncharacterized protein YndB with AHSA1/START domain
MSDKKQYQLEFLIKSSPKILYNCIATPSGMSEWFADDVNIKDEKLFFLWDGSTEEAFLLGRKPLEFIKFRWGTDDSEDTFVELRITTDPITKDVALIVTDFADEDEIEEAKQLWDAQVNNLMHILGC